MGGLSGQATDIDIHAREILRMREITNQLLAKHTGQKLEKVEKDVERDFIMNAQQAKEYGIIDDIIYKTDEGYDRPISRSGLAVLGVNDSSRFPHGHGAQQSREVRARRSLV